MLTARVRSSMDAPPRRCKGGQCRRHCDGTVSRLAVTRYVAAARGREVIDLPVVYHT